MRDTPQLVLHQTAKGKLHQIDPRAAGRREVVMESQVAQQPLPQLRCLVLPVVAEDHVNLQLFRNNSMDMLQNAEEFDTAVVSLNLAEDLPRGYIQRREQRCRAATPVVMGALHGRAVVPWQ